MNAADIENSANENQTDIKTTSPVSEQASEERTMEFFAVSEGKFLTLYILSFGFYGMYWFYKNWMLQKKYIDKNIYPVMRAIFSIFFTHSLFGRINKRAQQLEQKHTFNANVLATLFVASIVASNLIDPSLLSSDMLSNISSSSFIITSLMLFFVSAYPLVKVQATVNRINNDMLGYLNHKYSFWNYALIVLGVLGWSMIGFGLLAESLGLAG